MTEHIERETAINYIKENQCKKCSDIGLCGGCAVLTAIKLLQKIPAADVTPVRHGRWVKAKGSWCTPGGDPVWECSECGKGVHVYGIEHGTYGKDVADKQWMACPNCGAKMDGGENNGT